MDDIKRHKKRSYPQAPIVGVGAMVVKDGKILLIKRGNEPNKGQWSVPGGKVELGETLPEAVCREIREECGISVNVSKVLDVSDRIIRDNAGKVQYHFVLIDFLAEYVDGEAGAHSDASEMRWVTPSEMSGLDMVPRLHEIILHQMKSW